MQSYALNIPFEQWEQTGSEEDITSRLLAPSVVICGLPVHVEAFAVVEDAEGIQCAADPMFRDEVTTLQDMQDTAFRTVEMNGREYIIVATPHGA